MLFHKTSQEVDKGPLGIQMSDSDRQRILRYSTYWQFYLGKHWAWKREEGEPQMSFNYSRVFVDKAVAWLFGKGFNCNVTDPGAQETISPILEQIWKDNKKKLWGVELSQMASITGDAFVKIGWEEPNEFNGLIEGRIRAVLLDSSHCFPEWHPHNKEIMTSFRITYSYEIETVRGQKQKVIYTEVISPNMFSIADGDQRFEAVNSLGFIPIVHIKNKTVSASSYGLGDLNDFTSLNREYNEKSTNASDIINYHEAPITVVYGARATSLEKGANKLWSGLPKDAKVENLELQSDLGATNNYLETIKTAMFELSNIPEGALGKQQEISNTSAVALHVQYQPLMEMRDAKIITYEPGIQKVNRMALKIYELKKGLDFKVLMPEVKDPYETNITFIDPLPKDKLIILQEIEQRMNMPYPLITPPMALDMLGVEDIVGTLKHIEDWKALIGIATQPPNQMSPDVSEDNPPEGGEQPIENSNTQGDPTVAGNQGRVISQGVANPQGAVQQPMQSIYNSGPGA